MNQILLVCSVGKRIIQIEVVVKELRVLYLEVLSSLTKNVCLKDFQSETTKQTRNNISRIANPIEHKNMQVA